MSGSNLPELFSQLRQVETAVCHAGKRVSRNQARLEENHEESRWLMKTMEELKAKLETLDAEAKQLSREIAVDKVAGQSGQEQLTRLRFWGNACVLTDLPHELLSMVIQYLGYVHQQRVVRVSQTWKALITSLDHIYCDALSLFKGLLHAGCSAPRRLKAQRDLARTIPTDTKQQVAWKFGCQAVRHLTLDGMLLVHAAHADITYHSAWLARRFPSLVTLNFTRVKLTRCRLESHLADYLRLYPTVRVIFSQCVFTAFSAYTHLEGHVDGQDVLQDRLHGYRRVTHLSLRGDSPDDDLLAFRALNEDVIWPYPEEQLNWLARYAPYLKGPLLKLYCRFAWAPAVCQECKESFCPHRNAAFYRQKLDPQARNMLAVFILEMRIPGMEQPPARLEFEQVLLINGRYESVPELWFPKLLPPAAQYF